ncbi:hypothetical protein KY339_03460 [Candidatus Woesearchaeota archaeon]|nr:hypothetical protein [Candidatus Woesearchaeota archaeon]
MNLKTKIVLDKRLSGRDPLYPAVFSVEAYCGESMRFGFEFWLDMYGDGLADITDKMRIDGIVRNSGMSSKGVLDDADADDYAFEAEGKTVAAIVNHLQRTSPNTEIRGRIKSTFVSAYHGPHEYKIEPSKEPKLHSLHSPPKGPQLIFK